MKNQRISTGIPGLDEILNGGYLPASSYLLLGSPGTGKTVLSLQFLNECVKRNENCLMITFAEPEEILKRNAASFGWDLKGIKIVDFTSFGNENLPEGEYSVFQPNEVESEPVWKKIYDAIEENKPDRLVIDSATFLQYLSHDKYQYHKQIQALINKLSALKITTLFLFEPVELEKDNALALAVDGIISLRNDISPNRVIELRTIEIRKLRGSSFISGRHPFRITGNGLSVWPHKIEKLKKINYVRNLIPSGISDLDEMLMGGFHQGTISLISGPSGVGKTSLTLQFLIAAAERGAKCVHYTFEEGLASMLERCHSISLPLENYLESGAITIREINPLELYPDEFLAIFKSDIETLKADILSIDSLRGYNLAMEEFGSLTANMQNIVNYARMKKTNLFLVNEVEKLSGDLQITELGVSYVADNVLLLRYAELNGRLVRIISCIKKRMGSHQNELREYKITEKGISVGEKLTNWRGILTAFPSQEINIESKKND